MELGEGIKKILLAGIGTAAVTAEKSKEVLDELVKKGELTVEQGKVLNQELKHNIKESVKKNVNVTLKPSNPDELKEVLGKMTPDQLAALKAGWASRAVSMLADCSFRIVESACWVFSNAIRLRSSFFLSIFFVLRHFFLFNGYRSFWESFSFFEYLNAFNDGSICLVKILKISFQSKHIVDDVTKEVLLQKFV